MIKILYESNARKKIEVVDISGSFEDFLTLREELLNFLDNDDEKMQFETDKTDSEGWEFVLESLEIIKKSYPVKISVTGNKKLVINGSIEKLEIFADWLEFGEKIESGYHLHYEYFEGNKYIDSKSIPLIIRLK